jgi:excisionase family DNA binding protein
VRRDDKRYAKMQEVAIYLGLSERTIRAMVADGRLTAYKLGERIVRLDLDEVDLAMKPSA